MEDTAIIDLYWSRSENAISETANKYGNFCYSIAYNVLGSREDSQECVNDTYLAAWERMPPERPGCLSAFLAKITRNLSISRWRKQSAAKRGGGEVVLALEELNECAAEGQNVESIYLYKETIQVFKEFLKMLSQTERSVFLRRYFFLDSIANIARDFGFSQSKVKSMLMRTRNKLRLCLEKEGCM